MRKSGCLFWFAKSDRFSRAAEAFKVTSFGLLTVLFAACSLIYELFLAQTLTSVLGGSNFRYAMTIGLYISSMGLGAWLAWPLSDVLLGTRGRGGRSAFNGESRLIAVEAFLMVCGLLAAPYILIVERMRILSSELGLLLGGLAEISSGILFHAPILVIGILSGAELPLLMECASKRKDAFLLKEPLPEKPSGRFVPSILAWDYVGTVLGAIAFPFVLLPLFGVFSVSFLIVFLNGIGVLAVLFLTRGSRKPPVYVTLCLGLGLLGLLLLIWRADVHELIVKTLYFAG